MYNDDMSTIVVLIQENRCIRTTIYVLLTQTKGTIEQIYMYY